MHTRQLGSGHVPAYCINITIIIIIQKKSVQHVITVTESNSHACRISESSFMAFATNTLHGLFSGIVSNFLSSRY